MHNETLAKYNSFLILQYKWEFSMVFDGVIVPDYYWNALALTPIYPASRSVRMTKCCVMHSTAQTPQKHELICGPASVHVNLNVLFQLTGLW